MGVSLGTRVAGLCLAGTVAVVAASCVAGEAGPPSGGRDVSVAGGLSNGGPDGTPRRAAGSSEPAPSWRPDGSGGPVGAPVPDRPSQPPPPTLAVPTPTPRSDRPAKDDGTPPPHRPRLAPARPRLPDTDAVPDPAGLYDRLRTPATGCADVLRTIPPLPPTDDWRLLRGLANGRLAVQGRGGSWGTAARDHAELAGRPDGCKGRAAYAVLTGLAAVPRTTSRRHGAARERTGRCPGVRAYGIAAVDAGPGRNRPARRGDPDRAARHVLRPRRAAPRRRRVRRRGERAGPLHRTPRVTARPPAPHRHASRPCPPPPERRSTCASGTGGTEVAREGAFTLAAPDLTPSASP
ncbi:hypothetical protein LV779_09370 [Streptomyces thinghirensis]|nr:hypothetical protein [Streptomyces thinghirensis]